jgi:hypothetical protein
MQALIVFIISTIAFRDFSLYYWRAANRDAARIVNGSEI